MFKRHFNTLQDCKTPFAILEKKMLSIGKLTWVLHSEYSSASERNLMLENLEKRLTVGVRNE